MTRNQFENFKTIQQQSILKKDKHYDAVDILPSSSSFDKNYPEFYGDHTLSQQFL